MPKLSVIIPLHNEERRLKTAMSKLLNYRISQPTDMEVILAENGSTDITRELCYWYAHKFPWVRVVTVPERGKGAAVRAGMLAATGAWRYMADVDFSTPLSEIMAVFWPARELADVIIGSREMPESTVHTSISRRVIGRAFHALITGMIPNVPDTQCGFKLFHQIAAMEIFGRLKLTGLAFDVEVLYLARRLGYEIAKVPVHWQADGETRVDLVHDSARMLRDVLTIPSLHRADCPVKKELPA